MLRNVLTPVFESAIYRAIASVFDKVTYGGASPAFDPASLFTGGYTGGWYDPSDLSTLWQDSARTTPVTADGDPVGCIDDKSGAGNNLTQATGARRPLYKTSGGLHWLEFDGIDDCLFGAMDLSSTGILTAFVGIDRESNTGFKAIYEHTANPANVTAGSFSMFAPVSGTVLLSFWIPPNGVLNYFDTSTAYGTPFKSVTSCVYDRTAGTSATATTPRVNAATPAGSYFGASGTVDSSRKFANDTFYLGSRSNTTFRFDGKVYGLIIVSKQASGTEITDAETWLNTKTGAY